MVTPSEETPDDSAAIWVASDVLPDGSYSCVVQFTQDLAVTLSPKRAPRYAAAVAAAVAAAEYDAAVLRQLTSNLELATEDAVGVVQDLRAGRVFVDVDVLKPMTIGTGVSALTGQPFLKCTAGDLRWQWSPADAMQHAMQVLEVSAGVALDATYRRYLIGSVGLDQLRALNVVSDVANWRHPRQA